MRKLFVFAALAIWAALPALGAGNPTLEIQSPTPNASVPGNAVQVRFKTHDFKIVALNHMATGGGAAQAQGSDQSAAGSSPSMSASGGMSGMGPNKEASMAPPSGAGSNPQEVSPDASGASQPAPSGAAQINPHEGFVVVRVDNSPYFFFHTSNDPILLAFAQPGQHTVNLQLVTDDAKPTGQAQTINVTTGASAPGATPAPKK